MRVTKGLIIADAWAGYILARTKDWKMRSSATSRRSWLGLIRKGTGSVYGVARLIEVGTPLSLAEMIATYEHHRIPVDMIRSGEVAKWNIPWKLSAVHRPDRPVPYRYKSAAVTWVELDDVAIEGRPGALRGIVSFDCGSVGCVPDAAFSSRLRPEARAAVGPDGRSSTLPSGSTPSARQKSNSRWIGEIEINDANLRNDHFYLRPLIDRFPDDVIGGSNKASSARAELTIDWGGPEPVRTNIDGKYKKFFCARGWIGAFYKLSCAQAGDLVVIEETAPYRYRVRLKKPRSRGAGP